MPASIVKQYQLRTGPGSFTATTANMRDHWIVEVDEIVSQADFLELWVAVPGNPIPKGTLKQLGSNYTVCESIEAAPKGTQRYWWDVIVTWKELDSPSQNDVQNYTQPRPNNDSTDPLNWLPTVSRRSVLIHQPAEKAYYRGGYTGDAHAYFDDFNTSGDKAPLANSAVVRFDPAPEERRYISVWAMKWLRPTVPQALIDAEGEVNNAAFQWTHRGYTRTFAEKTARIDAVNLSETRWGNVQLWEIAVDIVEDPQGHAWVLADRGTAARAWDGDPDGDGGTLSSSATNGLPALRALLDSSGNPIQDPVYFDGDGQPIVETAVSTIRDEPAYGTWEDFETTDFGALPLIEDLEVP